MAFHTESKAASELFHKHCLVLQLAEEHTSNPQSPQRTPNDLINKMMVQFVGTKLVFLTVQ